MQQGEDPRKGGNTDIEIDSGNTEIFPLRFKKSKSPQPPHEKNRGFIHLLI